MGIGAILSIHSHKSTVCISQNRLSPCFINKATTAEPIKSGEGTLLQSKPRINKKYKENQCLPLKTREQDRGEPQLPDDALKSGSDLRRCHRHRDGQEFSPGALPREGTHSYARKRVTTPT
jgi:hypothetical protein